MGTKSISNSMCIFGCLYIHIDNGLKRFPHIHVQFCIRMSIYRDHDRWAVAGERKKSWLQLSLHNTFTLSRCGHCQGRFRGCVYLDNHIDKLLDACFGLTLWKMSIDIHIDKLLEMLSYGLIWNEKNTLAVNVCNNTLCTVTIYSFAVIIWSLAHRRAPYCTRLTGHIVDLALCWLVKLSPGFWVPPVSWQSKEISWTKLYAGATGVQPLRANHPGCVCECMHVYSLGLPTKSVHRLKNKECTSTLPMHLAFNLKLILND